MGKGPQNGINLIEIDEHLSGAQAQEEEGSRKLLPGFSLGKIKIHLLTEDLEKLASKQKYQGLFDVGVLSIHSSNKITEALNPMFKKTASIHVETSDNLVILKKEQRQEFREKVEAKAKEAGWTRLKGEPYSHHMLFQPN
mmetsp:Transcript_32934/g.50362  ORF Transcript_32934/g.50362 Transcript_32934/m.50362 type:complete len:140 (+) Transcript_32934:1128-1547(+)